MTAARDEEFSRYVTERSGALLRVAYLLTGNRADAEDLLQTALAKTYLSWNRIQDKGALDGYVRRVLVNTQTSWWRKRRVDEYATDQLPEQAWEDSRPAEFELRSTVWNSLAQLPRRQRAVVVLRYYEDLSEAETAEVMGISIGTVKSTASRALAKLRTDGALRDARLVIPAPTRSAEAEPLSKPAPAPRAAPSPATAAPLPKSAAADAD
ncbi:MAG: SigE family RNA polymerase sigma factor [Catenulispora sp.]